MKTLCLILFTIVLGSASASDTLSRAQVYSFAPGDTFDYKISYSFIGPVNNYSERYSRYVIADTYSSANADTMYVVRLRQWPLPSAYDTTVYSHADSTEWVAATPVCPALSSNLIVGLQYNGRVANEMQYNCFETSARYRYAAGLGVVAHNRSGGNSTDMFASISDSSLIYYAKQGESYGTPYYNQLAIGISEAHIQNILVYPTYSHGILNISGINSKCTFTLFNTMGQVVYVQQLQGAQAHQIKLPDMPAGMYLYRLRGVDNELAKGKIYME